MKHDCRVGRKNETRREKTRIPLKKNGEQIYVNHKPQQVGKVAVNRFHSSALKRSIILHPYTQRKVLSLGEREQVCRTI